MESVTSKSVIAEHEIIYKNDKPYIILALKEYERLVHSSETINAASIAKKKTVAKKNKKANRFPSGKNFMKGLEGIWKDRKDITDSVEFVRNLRKNATRAHIRKQMQEAGLHK